MTISIFTKFNFKILIPACCILAGCSDNETLFEKLPSEKTGVDFINQLEPTTDLNIFNYLYFYNGGGVGAGDLNGDGLIDLVFISNQEDNKLYLNQGDFEFQDISDRITEKTSPNKWSTGVSLADVNGDGLLDIYIGQVGSYLKIQGENKLYINKGNDENDIPQFSEEAKEYGLDLVGFSTQAAFFDYDQDNDLDMYMLNHSVHSNGTFGRSNIRTESHPLAGDRFFRNENGKYIDATEEVGIYNSPLGYGLGIGISDINNDGYPDVYIGNDFHEDDYLYINNGDGTFTESLADMINHTSRFSMGNDLADINNDGLIDILSLDMLPREYEKLKSSAGEDAYDVYQYKLKYGYKDQFARNTLQLNKGNGKFSEVGLMANIAATDWSWSGLFADFDLDGFNDLLVANGIVGRTNDMDYIKFMSNEAVQLRMEGNLTEQDLLLTEKMPVVKIPNYAFRNTGQLFFEEVSKEWGLNQESFSNGAIYADLDNDGDLDIVTNNINSEAFIYRNRTVEENPERNYLKLKLKGPAGNQFGVGAKMKAILPDNQIIIRELYPVRGYLSSVPHEIHLGLDSSYKALENVKIIWPDGKVNELSQIRLNQTIKVNYLDAQTPEQNELKGVKPVFNEITENVNVNYEHKENDFLEFNREALIPGMISALGPAFAKADIDADGFDDFFIGGAKHQPSFIYMQNADGTFSKDSLNEDPKYEDVDAVFLDYDLDGDLDLLVVSGGNEFWGQSEFLNPRIYRNNNNIFERDLSQMMDVHINASKIATADFDQDGDIDFFIGERAVPWKYGMEPSSLLIINDNGRMSVNENLLEGFEFGMVTDVQWADMDLNGELDLIVASDWSTLKILFQNEGKFQMKELPNATGLWTSLEIADMDNNGYPDIIGGNLGLNSKLAASGEKKLKMYVNDFDDNGSVEQVITFVKSGRERFFADKDELTKQVNFIKKKYLDYNSFASASIEDVFSREKLSGAKTYEVSDTRSAVFYQLAEGSFDRRPLPVEGQMAPVFDILVFDFNFDRLNDLMIGGNFTRNNIQRGKYDASLGEIFLQWNDQSLKYINQETHGLYLSGEVRHIEMLKTGKMPLVLVAKNDGRVEIYSFNY